MKIIKVGKGYNWTRVKCPQCESKLEIEESDVFLRKSRDSEGALEDNGYVTCPLCKKTFRVETPLSVVESRKELEKFRDHDL